MDQDPIMKLYAFTLDCKDPDALASFYANLLDWEIPFHDEDWACICPPGVQQGQYPGITFQRNPAYQPPVWPEEAQAQQQMAHLDFAVKHLEEAMEHAVRCGAVVAQKQFSADWRVLFDPAGHPFCLCQLPSIFAGEQFALL